MSERLSVGDPAPEFTLPDADGTDVSLASLRGKNVIVYFYPAAMTPGCTKQACDFRDSLDSLQAQGYAVLGVSPDKPAKLAKFRERDGVTFPLLSDPDKDGSDGVRRLRGEDDVRQEGDRRDPVDLRDRPGRQDRGRAVQREGHRPRRQTAPRSRAGLDRLRGCQDMRRRETLDRFMTWSMQRSFEQSRNVIWITLGFHLIAAARYPE